MDKTKQKRVNLRVTKPSRVIIIKNEMKKENPHAYLQEKAEIMGDFLEKIVLL